MNSARKLNFAAVGVLLAAGGLRLLWEPTVTRRFEEQGLLTPPLEIGVKEKIGQTSWAVTLGGLRTLVSTFTHLRAYDQFASQHWADLAKTYQTTVQLSPNSAYYWDLGSWHMYKNASSYYQSDSDLNPIRARAERLRWFEMGKSFLEQGVKNNPRNGHMHALLAALYEDPFLFPDDAAASEEYAKAIEVGGLGKEAAEVHRRYLYSLIRSGKDPKTTLQQVEELLRTDPRSRLPTMLGIDFALRWRTQDPEHPLDPIALAVGIYGSESKALSLLGPYFTAIRHRWPMDGVELTVRLLEKRAGIAPDSPRSNIRIREDAQRGVDELNQRGELPQK